MSRTVPESSSRFIPISSSSQVYKNGVKLQINHIPPVGVSLREDFLFSGIDSSFSSEGSSIFSSNIPESNTLSPIDNHQETIANALDFNNSSKVLTFKSSPRKFDLGFPEYELPTIKKPLSMKTAMISDILQAPGLRNDYYSNLVSWSRKTNRVAVGLGSKIYLWGVDNKVISVNYEHESRRNSNAIVTAISCSNEYWIIVATSGGKILLIDQIENKVIHEYRIKEHKCVYCITWFPNSLNFIAGDDYGDVYFFKLQQYDKVEMILQKSIKCHQQHICGLALNNTNDELAVGANDNCCTIWDISNIHQPLLKFILPHNAAIKALSYCPWTSSLLATGGGSKDRKIRFWHTATGTLLHEYYTDGQITSLKWCHYKKEIVATFGFGGGGGYHRTSHRTTTNSPSTQQCTLLCVYSYPKMIPLIEVNAAYNLRILSSTMSPDNCSICVATNDSTIRIYKLWEKSMEICVNYDSSKRVGTYGSSIIELIEGITKSGDPIR